MSNYILWLKEVNFESVPEVGGKNASLGEMYGALSKKGVNVPEGFALTTKAYWHFLKENNLDRKLRDLFKEYNPKSIKSLQETGKKTRKLILNSHFPKDLEKEIIAAYKELSKRYGKSPDVAVRSSGVVEDMPDASFAGQFETFLNVKGEEKLLKTIRECFASTFNDRVISYRDGKGIDHLKFALSVGILKMVRSDLASSGIMFTLDTETGFPNVILINSIWGIGEMIVQGKITPDEFYVFKPTLEKNFKPIIVKNLGRKNRMYEYASKGGLKETKVKEAKRLKFSLTDEEILTLARWAKLIEDHYSKKFNKWMPQDIEWAKDGKTGELFIVQSRPETVHAALKKNTYREYTIKAPQKPVLNGIAVGDKIATGKVRIIPGVPQMSKFKKGEVLVTQMTDPDWVPIMRKSSAIITDEGGKTCHASIVARELGIPAIVGTGKATQDLKTGDVVTVDCTQGRSGRIFKGRVPFKVKEHNLKKVPDLKTKIMMNVGAPEAAFRFASLPVEGVGLAREEFIIAEKIKVHPLALYHFDNLKDKRVKKRIRDETIEHKDKRKFFVKELAEGVAQIASSVYPKEAIVRFSDFKSNEYKNLIGGELFEKEETNPMLGFRGASRYISEEFRPAFEMECRAIKRAREIFGLKNINVMVPFCRTTEEGEKTLKIMKKQGLPRGKDLNVYVMCEIPSNVILIDEFLKIFDGVSIGSNDLTQLALGLDRDNGRISYVGDERDPAVKKMISKTISFCNSKGKYCGICGDAPSSLPSFARFLVKEGIPSMSLSPDAVMKTILILSNKNV